MLLDPKDGPSIPKRVSVAVQHDYSECTFEKLVNDSKLVNACPDSSHWKRLQAGADLSVPAPGPRKDIPQPADPGGCAVICLTP